MGRSVVNFVLNMAELGINYDRVEAELDLSAPRLREKAATP